MNEKMTLDEIAADLRTYMGSAHVPVSTLLSLVEHVRVLQPAAVVEDECGHGPAAVVRDCVLCGAPLCCQACCSASAPVVEPPACKTCGHVVGQPCRVAACEYEHKACPSCDTPPAPVPARAEASDKDVERARKYLATMRQFGEGDDLKLLAFDLASAREEGRREGLEKAERYASAIRWALGENGRFNDRRDGDGPFWWRTELRRRAALIGDKP